jgi:hypothetical protein
MHRFVLTAIFSFVTITAAFAQNTPTSKIAPSKGWLSDFGAARAEALKTEKPLMVVFRCDP